MNLSSSSSLLLTIDALDSTLLGGVDVFASSPGMALLVLEEEAPRPDF